MEAIALNSKTVIIKSERERDIAEVIDFVSSRDKSNNINALLDFASKNRVVESDYVFDRDDCYD